MLDKYDKRQLFQEAQAKSQTSDGCVFQSINFTGADYGSELKHLKQEANEAYQQVQTALSTASEHQRAQLEQLEQDLQGMINRINTD